MVMKLASTGGIVEFSNACQSQILNDTVFHLASARQHLANGWRRWVQTENVYSNPNPEISMSDNAHHNPQIRTLVTWVNDYIRATNLDKMAKKILTFSECIPPSRYINMCTYLTVDSYWYHYLLVYDTFHSAKALYNALVTIWRC